MLYNKIIVVYKCYFYYIECNKIMHSANIKSIL